MVIIYFMENDRSFSGEKKQAKSFFYLLSHNPYYIMNRLGNNNQKYNYLYNNNIFNSNYAPLQIQQLQKLRKFHLMK